MAIGPTLSGRGDDDPVTSCAEHPPARLYLWDDRFLWVSTQFRGAMTRRYATNVAVAMTATPFLLKLPGQAPKSAHAILCSSRARRRVDATQAPFLSLNLDPGTPEARRLEALADHRGVCLVDQATVAPICADGLRALRGPVDDRSARALGDALIARLAGATEPCPLEPRVARIAEHIKTVAPVDIDAAALA